MEKGFGSAGVPCPWGSGSFIVRRPRFLWNIRKMTLGPPLLQGPKSRLHRRRWGGDLTVPARWEGLHVPAGWEGLEVGGECLLISFRVLGRHSLGPSWGSVEGSLGEVNLRWL